MRNPLEARRAVSKDNILPEELARWSFRSGGVMVKGRTEPFVSRVGPVLVVVLVIDLLSSPKKTEIEDDEEEDWERRVKSAFHFGFSCEA